MRSGVASRRAPHSSGVSGQWTIHTFSPTFAARPGSPEISGAGIEKSSSTRSAGPTKVDRRRPEGAGGSPGRSSIAPAGAGSVEALYRSAGTLRPRVPIVPGPSIADPSSRSASRPKRVP